MTDAFKVITGMVVGLKYAKELFRQSDVKGGCTSKGCCCFLCLCDKQIAKLKDDMALLVNR